MLCFAPLPFLFTLLFPSFSQTTGAIQCQYLTDVTVLTKNQFIELLSPTIHLFKDQNPTDVILKLIEDIQEIIVRSIHEEISHLYDEYITEYNDLNWQYVLDNNTQTPYFYFIYNSDIEYNSCIFTYELALGERSNADINTTLLCISLFYDNIKRFYPSSLTSKAMQLLRASCNREEKAILTFITNLKLFL